MKIAVGTMNEAKKAAVSAIFSEAFETDVELLPHDVESGISSMPMANEETATGAINRAFAVREIEPDADYYVGLEGGVYEGPRGMYLLGWVAILKSGSDVLGLGHSGGVKLPRDIAEALRAGGELGPLMKERTGDDIRHSLGTTGLLTKGLYPRNREFEDALRNGLAEHISPEYYANEG